MQRSYLAENVSAGVPESVAAFVGFKSEELELTIRLQRPRHVPENPIDLRNQSVGSQTLRNLSRNVQWRCHPLLPFLHSPIRQRNPSKKKKKNSDQNWVSVKKSRVRVRVFLERCTWWDRRRERGVRWGVWLGWIERAGCAWGWLGWGRIRLWGDDWRPWWRWLRRWPWKRNGGEEERKLRSGGVDERKVQPWV